MKKMCVIGSLNVDVITTMDRFPVVGESIFVNTFDIFTGGGKGANQAFALGRLGADVTMVGKLGDKFYGPEYFNILVENNVNCEGITIEKDMMPGIGLVGVDKNGDNILFVFPGANDKVNVNYIEEKWEIISQCDIFLFELEIPEEANLYAMKKLKEIGKTIIFDPAPAKGFKDEYLQYIDYITPNETELQSITGIPAVEERDFELAGRTLIKRGAKIVIAKAGRNGAYIIDEKNIIHVPGYKVNAVDTTAAGDSFNAGFAFSLANGTSILESVEYANAVAALSTTAIGAQAAMPTVEQVREFLMTEKETRIYE